MKRVVLLFYAVCFGLVSFAQDPVEKINQANEALKAKDYATAFQLYEDAMNNLTEDVQVPDAINYNIGLAGYNSENFEKAIAYFDKAITADVNVSRSHYYKARCYDKLGDNANVVASYEMAIETAGDSNTDAYVYGAAIAAYKGEMFDKAVTLFGQCVDAGYKGETAQYYKAVVLKKQGKDDDYKAALEAGAEMFPDDSKIGPALANIYVSEGNELYKKGAAILSAANQKVNDGAMTTADDAYIAEVEKAKVEFAAAVEVLEKAQALDATNENAQKLLDACKSVL